jgi:hypothetical protein
VPWLLVEEVNSDLGFNLEAGTTAPKEPRQKSSSSVLLFERERFTELLRSPRLPPLLGILQIALSAGWLPKSKPVLATKAFFSGAFFSLRGTQPPRRRLPGCSGRVP